MELESVLARYAFACELLPIEQLYVDYSAQRDAGLDVLADVVRTEILRREGLA